MQVTYKAFEVDLPVINDKTFNIADLGAVSGGKVPCTEAIKKAMDSSFTKIGVYH